MSIRGKIEEARPSKSGKTLGIKIGSTWYSTKNWELQNMVGQTIEAETSTSEFNGNTMHWLNDYTEAQFQTADEAFNAAHAGNAAPQAPQRPVQQVNKFPEPPRIDTQCSIVAQALTKAITSPADNIEKVWQRYQAFYLATMAWNHMPSQAAPQETADTEDFSDEIPF